MNKVEQEFDDLENELRAMTPRAPSPDLKTRIEDALVPEPHPAPLFRWIGIAAAVLVALGLTLYSNRLKTTASEDVAISWQPVVPETPSKAWTPTVTTQRLVVNEVDEGVFHMRDVGPVRRIRYQTMLHSTWASPETGEPLSITTPEEQIVFVRLNNQL